MLFYEGSKVLLRVALTLVKQNKEKLLQADSFAKAVDIFKVMVTEPAVLNCHSFMMVGNNNNNKNNSSNNDRELTEQFHRLKAPYNMTD